MFAFLTTVIVELILKEPPKLEFEGYKKTEFSSGTVFSNPIEKRVEIVVKNHPDGRVGVFTDKSEIIEGIVRTTQVIDIHAR